MYYLQLILSANPLGARNRKSVPSHSKKEPSILSGWHLD